MANIPSMNRAIQGIRVWAHAKINLTLAVLGRRPDGYHELESIMQSLDLADEVHLFPLAEGEDLPIRLVCNDRRVPLNAENLAWRAAALLRAEAGVTGGVRILLHKEIPMAAGLAGGSADAAAVLAGLNRLWGLGLAETDLVRLGLRLGADVAFCLRGGTMLVQGYGDQLTPLPDLPTLWLVLVKPPFGLATREVYQAYDDLLFQQEPGLSREHADTVATLDAVMRRDLSRLEEAMGNDLAAVAFRLCPQLHEIKERMLAAGVKKVCMSGSGPTLLGLTNSQEEAEDVAALLRRELPKMEMIRPVRTWPRGLEIEEI